MSSGIVDAVHAKRAIAKELGPKRGERLISMRGALEACAYPEAAVAIIEESEFTTHNKVGLHRHLRCASILNDMFERAHFAGKRVLELGPGHYSFAMIARALGAEVSCVERYEPHARLGRALGFGVYDEDFLSADPEVFGGAYDGVWMKGAFNACIAQSVEALDASVCRIDALVKDGGWGWVVTVNKVGETARAQGKDDAWVDARIEAQRASFEQRGWRAHRVDEGDRTRYALSYKGARYIFTKGLDPVVSDEGERASSVEVKKGLLDRLRGVGGIGAKKEGVGLPMRDKDARAIVDVDEGTKSIAMETTNRFSVERGPRTARLMGALLTEEMLRGKRVLEIGPGQYAFALLARALGARVTGLDSNEPIVRLGRTLGFEVFEGDLKRMGAEDVGGAFDGLWLKGAFNPTTMDDHGVIREVAGRLDAMVVDGGWGIVAPNGRADALEKLAGARANVGAQREAFEALGWRAIRVGESARAKCAMREAYYGAVPWVFVKGDAGRGVGVLEVS